MSADTVDDLHEAEDMAAMLAAALKRLADADKAPSAELRAALGHARVMVAQWSSYCRPTCGAEGDARVAAETCEDPDDCGCPCGHGEW